MSRGVRPGNRAAALDVDLGEHPRADGDLAGRDPAAVHDQPGHRRLHVSDLDLGPILGAAARGGDHAGVSELAAALRVKRRPVKHHIDLGARAGGRYRHPAAEQADDGRLAGHVVVTGEQDLARAVEEPGEDRDVSIAGLLLCGVLLGSLPLLRHQPAELRLVDGQALLRRHFQGQVDRKAIGVVQLERQVTADGANPAAPGLLHCGIEDRGSGAERTGEGGLFRVDHGVEVRSVLVQLRVLVPEGLDGGRGQLVQVVLAVGAAWHAA